MNATWYAVLTKARKEGLVHRLLHRQGFETLYLHYVGTVKHARKTWKVLRPYFPRYIFAGIVNELTVHQINRTVGVSTVVYLADEPLEIPGPVIEELRGRGDKRGLVRLELEEGTEHRRRYHRGEQVRISGGPLEGLLAIVALDRGHEVSVWLRMFGGRVQALFAPEGLKSVSPERGLIQIPPRQGRR